MNTVVGWGVYNVIWQIDFARNRVPLGLLEKGELSRLRVGGRESKH